MNKYAIIIYDDRKGANPYKIEFDYEAKDKECARRFGEDFAVRAFSENANVAVHVEFRKALKD